MPLDHQPQSELQHCRQAVADGSRQLRATAGEGLTPKHMVKHLTPKQTDEFAEIAVFLLQSTGDQFGKPIDIIRDYCECSSTDLKPTDAEVALGQLEANVFDLTHAIEKLLQAHSLNRLQKKAKELNFVD